MNERYYCSKNPAEHREFIAKAVVQEYWLLDTQGHYIETFDTGDVVREPEMDEAECASRGCTGKIVFGLPPSPLELLAREAK